MEKRGKFSFSFGRISFTASPRALYSLVFLLVLAIISVGVYALTPGVAPNPGHLITEAAPPSPCTANQFLKFDGTTWVCAAAGSGGALTTTSLSFVDSAGVAYPDNWIGRHTDGTNDWLHIGGITSNSVRRTGIWSDIIFLSGNVGIGTASPIGHVSTRKALIVSDTVNDALIEIWGTLGHKAILQSVGGVTYVGSVAKGIGTGDTQITYGDGSMGMILLGSNGNVGIGKNNPANPLEVCRDGACAKFVPTVDNYGNDFYGGIDYDLSPMQPDTCNGDKGAWYSCNPNDIKVCVDARAVICKKETRMNLIYTDGVI